MNDLERMQAGEPGTPLEDAVLSVAGAAGRVFQLRRLIFSSRTSEAARREYSEELPEALDALHVACSELERRG